MNNVQEVTKIIRTLRESKGYSQEYLAIKLDISQNAYSKIEIGQTRLNLDRFLQIAEVLGVDVCYLLESTEHLEMASDRRLSYLLEKA